jgi:tetratricopeptide (TPR) repeat protein
MTRRSCLGPSTLSLMASLSLPAAAFGQSATTVAAADSCPAPAPADTEAAKTSFRDGQAAFTEGAYARALELWSHAYLLDCTAHALLLNLAMAHELLGRPEDAAQTLELFNRRAPESPYVNPNLRRIARLRRVWAEQTRARARAQRRSSPPAATPTRPPAEPNVLPLALAAGGGMVGLTGLALYVQGRASAASAADRCVQSRTCADADDAFAGERARERAEIAGWLTGGGLVTAAVGTLWYLLSPPAQPVGIEWGASVSDAGTSLHLRGTY